MRRHQIYAIAKVGSLLAHKLPHDGQNQLLVAVHDVQTSDVDHTEFHHFAQVHNIVAILHQLKAGLGVVVDSKRCRKNGQKGLENEAAHIN
jgi:hypothetical protein